MVIPTFNASQLVSEAAESVLAQDPRPDQVLVVDDGSTDATALVMERFAGRVEYIRQPNRGPSAARNAGLAHLRTDMVVFLDADDFLLPGALARRYALLADCGAAWGYTDGWVQETTGAQRLFSRAYPPPSFGAQGLIFSDLLCRNFITTGAAVLRRQALLDIGGFDEDLGWMEDWDLWLRLALRYPVRYDPQPGFVQRRGQHTLSTNRLAMIRGRHQVLAKIYRLFPKDVAAAGMAARRSVADAHNAIGFDMAVAGRWADAAPFLWTSVRLWPLQRRALWLLLRCLVTFGRTATATRKANPPLPARPQDGRDGPGRSDLL